MMKRQISAVLCALAAASVLSGCVSLLDRTYSTVEEHSSKYWESEADDTLRAETYQDIVNDLLLLIGRHTENAVLRLYNYEDDSAVADALEKAAAEVQNDTPMGAYAVKYITSGSQAQRGYYEITLRIGYRRTADQIRAVVNATSTAALPDLLNAALDQEKNEVAVRMGYWGEDGAAKVAAAVASVRESRGLTGTEAWTVAYYPSAERAGLIEFILGSVPEEDGAAASASASAAASAAASASAAAAASSSAGEISQPKG